MRPVLVCPTHHEKNRISRALGPTAARWEIACSGPGAAAMARLGERWPWPGRPMVILAGLAGALGDLEPGSARWITAIHDADHVPQVTGAAEMPCRMATARAAVGGRARGDLRAATGADLVDLESSGFASAAARAGIPWGIVRGVSDGPTLEPPDCVWDWIDARGRLRLSRVVVDLSRHPSRIPALRALGRASATALRAVAGLLDRLGDGE